MRTSFPSFGVSQRSLPLVGRTGYVPRVLQWEGLGRRSFRNPILWTRLPTLPQSLLTACVRLYPRSSHDRSDGLHRLKASDLSIMLAYGRPIYRGLIDALLVGIAAKRSSA